MIIAVLSVLGSRFFGDFKDIYDEAGLRNTEQSNPDKMYVSFIDVGQGNCTLLRCGGKTILVDSGEVGAARILSCLRFPRRLFRQAGFMKSF